LQDIPLFFCRDNPFGLSNESKDDRHWPLTEFHSAAFIMAKKKTSGGTKSSAPTSSSARKPGSGRKAKIATAATAQLRQQKDDMREEFSNAKTTKAAYSGYLSRGRVIVADSVKERRAKEKEDPSWKCPENIDTDLLAKALEGPPNRHSVYALELVLTQKCGVEGHGKSTAEGIHGAFAKYWDELCVRFI
jgi:hypothetical protein